MWTFLAEAAVVFVGLFVLVRFAVFQVRAMALDIIAELKACVPTVPEAKQITKYLNELATRLARKTADHQRLEQIDINVRVIVSFLRPFARALRPLIKELSEDA